MTEVTIKREPLAGILESGLEVLLREHWEEVAHDRDVVHLAPLWSRYFELEEAGEFVAFSARQGGALVGYSAFFTPRSLHYRDHVFATNDVIFVRKGARGAAGLRLILEAEKALKDRSITKVFYHTKPDAVLGGYHDSLDEVEEMMKVEDDFGLPELRVHGSTMADVLVALGYKHVENAMGKLLKEGA